MLDDNKMLINIITSIIKVGNKKLRCVFSAVTGLNSVLIGLTIASAFVMSMLCIVLLTLLTEVFTSLILPKSFPNNDLIESKLLLDSVLKFSTLLNFSVTIVTPSSRSFKASSSFLKAPLEILNFALIASISSSALVKLSSSLGIVKSRLLSSLEIAVTLSIFSLVFL